MIFNEDCFITMNGMPENHIDIILTSPPYNTNKKAKGKRTLKNTSVKDGQYNYVRYDEFSDEMTDEEYAAFTKNLFVAFDKVLKPNGCVLYNLSYGAENTEGMFKAINAVLCDSPFTIADVIVWKKSNAFPNSCSSNRLTRLVEFVFVLCRKTEKMTFHCNKRVKSVRKTGQKAYENIFNFVEAKNNDGTCPFNKATYSSDLCEKLLTMYAPDNSVVYDPFLGSGTTAVACKRMGLECIGSEISPKQCDWAAERIEQVESPPKKKPLLSWLDSLLEVAT